MMNQTNNAWDANLTKVSSLGEISKLMPALTPHEEVQPEPVQEEKKMSNKELIRAALEYSIAHPNESLVSVAKMYGISNSAMYNARHLHKKRLLKGAKNLHKEAMVYVSIRIPKEVLDFYSQFNNRQAVIREALQAYIEQDRKERLNDESDQ